MCIAVIDELWCIAACHCGNHTSCLAGSLRFVLNLCFSCCCCWWWPQGYTAYVEGLYFVCSVVLLLVLLTVVIAVVLKKDDSSNPWLKRCAGGLLEKRVVLSC
jgi:uncharacterized membrane protein